MPLYAKGDRQRPGTRRTNTIANSIRIFRGLEGLSEVPYLAPLKPICGLAIAILELTQTLRKLRDDHAELIDRIKQLALILDASKGETRAITAEVGELEGALREIVAVLEEERQLSWFQRVRKTQELKDNVLSCTAKLDACIERFTVGSLLRIQHLLIEDKDEIHVFKESSIFLERSFQSLSHGTLLRGRITQPLQPAPCSRVVVKRYNEDAAARHVYNTDVELLRRLRHPNLHQLMGTSVSTAKSPFLVLPEFESVGVTHFIDQRLNDSGIESFMATLRVCQGIASGIEYLRTQCSKLCQSELEACFLPSNIVLTTNGQPIVGHNLVINAPALAPVEALPPELDVWLKQQLLKFVNSIMYGELDLSDWNLLMARRQGRRASHLRLLEHFTSYAVPSFTYSTFLFDSLLESLEYAYRRNELSFQTIRSTSVALWCGAFVYRPKVPIKCVLGDIGYMREDGEFVVLTNASDLVAKDSVKDSSVTLKSTSGEPVVQGSPDGSGIVRHVFGKTLYASIRRRKILEKFSLTRVAWNYFIPRAKGICQSFSTIEVPLRVPDLIFIVGVEEDLRISTFDRKGSLGVVPCDVEFLEEENPPEGSSWGKWYAANSEGATITDTRYAQNLLFIQLEEEDVE